MVLRFDDPKTGYRIYCFWNPRVKRRFCFLFGYIDKRFRIIRFLREFYVCVTATYISEKYKDWTKNLYLESQHCLILKYDEYKFYESDDDFMNYINSKIEKAERYFPRCFSMFGATYEVAGSEITSIYTESYCCVFRRIFKRVDEIYSVEIGKYKCYEYSTDIDFTRFTKEFR